MTWVLCERQPYSSLKAKVVQFSAITRIMLANVIIMGRHSYATNCMRMNTFAERIISIEIIYCIVFPPYNNGSISYLAMDSGYGPHFFSLKIPTADENE